MTIVLKMCILFVRVCVFVCVCVFMVLLFRIRARTCICVPDFVCDFVCGLRKFGDVKKVVRDPSLRFGKVSLRHDLRDQMVNRSLAIGEEERSLAKKKTGHQHGFFSLVWKERT